MLKPSEGVGPRKVTKVPDNLQHKEKETVQRTEETSRTERRRSEEVFGGLLGENETGHSAEYYDKMISKINEQISLAVSRNKSPYAVYGLGSDDEDDWC